MVQHVDPTKQTSPVALISSIGTKAQPPHHGVHAGLDAHASESKSYHDMERGGRRNEPDSKTSAHWLKHFTYIDDFLGGSRQDHVCEAATVVHEIIRGVLGLTGLSEKKNVGAQVADIVGILVECTKGTLRPKDKAI